MPDRMYVSDHSERNHAVPIVIILLCCIALVMWLKLTGIVLAALILAMTAFVTRYRPNSAEARSLRSSIQLSAENILDVINEYEKFCTSPEAESLADRTLHRPALLDRDCSDTDIEEFLFEYDTSKRFLNRLDARLQQDLTVQRLEILLDVTDRRALEIKEKWLAARKAALRLGPNYEPDAVPQARRPLEDDHIEGVDNEPHEAHRFQRPKND